MLSECPRTLITESGLLSHTICTWIWYPCLLQFACGYSDIEPQYVWCMHKTLISVPIEYHSFWHRRFALVHNVDTNESLCSPHEAHCHHWDPPTVVKDWTRAANVTKGNPPTVIPVCWDQILVACMISEKTRDYTTTSAMCDPMVTNTRGPTMPICTIALTPSPHEGCPTAKIIWLSVSLPRMNPGHFRDKQE